MAEVLSIPSDTAGIELALHHRRSSGSINDASGERTILLVHGATYSSESLYGVPLGGRSVLDMLAEDGFDVYALDVRGYGKSTRPREMSLPATEHPPVVRTEVAVRDLSTAVDYILKRKGIESLNLFAMSWGGTIVGAYTSRHNAQVRKLAMLAPQWISPRPPRIDGGGPLNAYRTVTPSAALKNWLASVPQEKQAGLIPQGWFDQWVRVTLASGEEPQDGSGSMRIPAGAVLDVRECWASGKSIYDPGEITVPVLLLHPEWDQDVPIELALEYFQKLRSAPYKRWVEIGEGTHLILLEKNRMQVMQALLGFLHEDYRPESR